MTTVSISRLKDQLSEYLRRVAAGEVVLVSDRRRIVARVERAVDQSPTDDDDEAKRMDRLEREGVLRLPSKKLSTRWLAKKVAVRGSGVSAVLRERQSSRW